MQCFGIDRSEDFEEIVRKHFVVVERYISNANFSVFRISRPPIEYHFSCYNCGDMKNWMQKIAFASAVYGGQTRSTSQSVSQVAAHRLSDSSDDPLHYNTLTGMPGRTVSHQNKT